MLRSMYAGISGLKNMQMKLDVIGNNIANVNTFGYKKGRVTFSDLVSQQVSGASAPGVDHGGTNPKQVGLGSTVGSIDNIHTQGSLQTTGRALDLAISGDGYFVVNQGFEDFYTRGGNLYVDQEGMLVNSDGMRLMGYGVDDNGQIDRAGRLGQLHINDGAIHQPATDSLTIVGNLNPTDSPLVHHFKVFDDDGNGYDENLTFTYDTTAKNWNYQIDGDLAVNNGSGKLAFDSNGQLKEGDSTINGPITATAGGNTLTIPLDHIDFDGLTESAELTTTADVIGDVAKMKGYQVSDTGQISAVLSNGDVQFLGQIAIANFNNPGGLEKAGNNLYTVTNNSGVLDIGIAGDGRGSIQAGALEMSNVDLADAFTEMIVAQRAFQANTRIITTSDEVLQELVNLKR